MPVKVSRVLSWDFLFCKRLHAALGTDGEDMAGALAQGRVDPCAEGIQQVEGNECLHRAGKTAAMYAEGSPPLQIMLAPVSYTHLTLPTKA